MRVFVYFNLHRKCWSVKALDGPCKGRVFAHASKVILRDATFKVSEAGRQRVLREGRKNVHAGVVGELEGWLGRATSVGWGQFVPDGHWLRSDCQYLAYGSRTGAVVYYNPHQFDSFVTQPRGARVAPHSYPIHEAPMAALDCTGRPNVWAFDPLDMPQPIQQEI